MITCSRCGATQESMYKFCPQCGAPHEFRPEHATTLGASLTRFVDELWFLLSSPAQFFRRMPSTGGYTAPLVFALTTHWIGTAARFLWSFSQLGSTHSSIVQTWIDRSERIAGNSILKDRIRENLENRAWSKWTSEIESWSEGMRSVILDPFKTLLSIFVLSGFIWVAARIFGEKRGSSYQGATYEASLRIVCYSTGATILLCIPFLGPFAAWVMGALLIVVGAREVFQVTTPRAIIIGLFPQMLVVSISLVILMTLIGLAFFALR